MEHGALYKRHAIEDVIFVMPVLVIGRGYGYAVAPEQLFGLPDLHDPLGIPVWQRPEQGCVEYAEHSDIRTDSKRHGHQRGYREARSSQESANPVVDMTQHRGRGLL